MRARRYAVAAVVPERVPAPHPGRSVVLLVGSGNNGGDALYAGRVSAAARDARSPRCCSTRATAHPGWAARPAPGRRPGRCVRRPRGCAAVIRPRPTWSSTDCVGSGGQAAAAGRRRRAGRAGERHRRAAGRGRPAERHRPGHRPGPRRRVPADVTVTFGGIKAGLLIADAAGRHDRLRADRHGHDRPAGRGLIAMTDGTPAPDAAGSRAGRGQVLAAALVGHRRRLARLPGSRGAVRSAARSAPGPAWSATPGRRPPRCVARWPEVVAGDSTRRCRARCRPGWSGPGWAPTGRRSPCCAGCWAQDVPVLVDADGLTMLAAMPALLQAGAGRVSSPC